MNVGMWKLISTRPRIFKSFHETSGYYGNWSNHKHIVYIPELLRCHTIIMVNFN